MNVEYALFDTRTSRTEYLNCRFESQLHGKVLDVGCNEAPLRKLRPELDYTGVDIAGSPDIQLDLENIDRLPFEDNLFDTVICIDVLEHVDNLHALFLELVRVARTYIIVSLPNCWSGARQPLHRGKGSIGHYGLPLTRPPRRHKWFFSLTDAKAFLEGQEESLSLSLVTMEANERPRFFLKRLIRHLRYPRQLHYLNRYAHTLWAVYRKGE